MLIEDDMTTVVIDTNLIIAGRWNPGSSSARIIDMVLRGDIRAVYTADIKEENLYILGKVKPPEHYTNRILEFYRVSRKVESKRRISACPDKADNRFLEAASAGKAEYIVSSDRHLLDMKEFEGIRILKPEEFEKELKAGIPID